MPDKIFNKVDRRGKSIGDYIGTCITTVMAMLLFTAVMYLVDINSNIVKLKNDYRHNTDEIQNLSIKMDDLQDKFHIVEKQQVVLIYKVGKIEKDVEADQG